MLPFNLIYKFDISTDFTIDHIRTDIKSIISPNNPNAIRTREEWFEGKVDLNEFKIKTVGELGRKHVSIICHGTISGVNNVRVISVKCSFGFYPWYSLSILAIPTVFVYYCIFYWGLPAFSGYEHALIISPMLIILMIYLLFVFMFNKRVKKVEALLKSKMS